MKLIRWALAPLVALACLVLGPPVLAAPDGAAKTPGYAGTESRLAGCLYRSGSITATDGQQMALGCDASGQLITSGSGGGGSSSGGGGGGGAGAALRQNAALVTATAATTSARSAITGPFVLVYVPSSATVGVRFATGDVTVAAVATSYIVPPGGQRLISLGSDGYLAYKTDSSTATFEATPVDQVDDKTIIVGATFTTPAGTTAYADNDLIANSGTAGSVTPLDFTTACRVPNGKGMIRRGRVKTVDSGMAGKSAWLNLYQDSPTVANGDNGALSSTESNFLGRISVLFDMTFSDPMYKGVGVPAAGSEINFQCASGSQHLYGLLSANGASATLQGAKAWTVVLEIKPD